MRQVLQISKLDAAKRQLETAIQIYFGYGDPVSIHTLAAAAYNVIRDLTEKRGAQPMLVKGQVLEFAKPETRELLRKKLNEAENFFKHADWDHGEVHDFSPDLSELFLLDATAQYYVLTGEGPPLFKVYRSWIVTNSPDFFTFPAALATALAQSRAELVAMGRAGFLQAMLPLAMRI